MGCCLFAGIITGMPRLALVLWWLFEPRRVVGSFDTIIWPLLGVILLPWTTLMYVFVLPGGLSAINWIALIVAFAVDLGSYGGARESRRRYSA